DQDRVGIVQLWNRAVGLGSAATLDDVLRLYTAKDRERIATMDAAQRDREAADGDLGVLFVPASRLPLPLQAFRMLRVEVRDGVRLSRSPAVTVVAGTQTITCPIVRIPAAGGLGVAFWEFAAGKVRIE